VKRGLNERTAQAAAHLLAERGEQGAASAALADTTFRLQAE